MRSGAGLAASAAALVLSGCAYVGDPQPPSLNIPSPVADLRVLQRASKLVFEFTIPELTTDGVILKNLGEVDLRGGPAGAGAADMDTWAAGATAIPLTASETGEVRLEIPAAEWVGREALFAVRVANRRGRLSEWSNAVRLRVVPPLTVPKAVQAVAVSDGVRLSWQTEDAPPGLAFRIYRQTPDEQAPVLAFEATGDEWVDTTTQYGQTYRYAVQAVLQTGQANAESEVTAPVSVRPIDRFPPAVPRGLTALPGLGTIELAWEPNRETDLRGYRVYRSEGDAPVEIIADLVETPSYSDRAVASGKSYRYVVSSVDQLGNESERSGAVEAAVP